MSPGKVRRDKTRRAVRLSVAGPWFSGMPTANDGCCGRIWGEPLSLG